ncbi:MAG: hypothetical protein OXG97_01860 [Candidatus Poribacteria bacterium]|nr:hypothetical protein [Candidatus Poribacteria bacterium]
MKDSRLLRHAGHLLAVVILCFLIKRLYSLLIGLDGETVVFQPFWLLTSLVFLLGYRTLLVYPWRTLYCSASQTHVSFRSVWTLFQLSQLGKYFPGKVGQFASILVLCRPLELSKTPAVVSTLQSVVLQCALGVCMGVPVFLSPSAIPLLHNGWAFFRRNAPILLGIAIVIIFGVCAVAMLLQKCPFFSKMPGLQEGIRILFSVLVTRRGLGLLCVHILLWFYFGIAFCFFIKSMVPSIQGSHLLMIITIYPLAWSLGVLSLVTPGGLGIREGILSVLLTLCLPPATATLAALLSRVWVMSAEILLASIAWGFYSKHKTPVPQ